MDTPRIKLYVIRDFGNKFNATFDFLKENWKVLFKYITYLLLPLCLFQGMSINVFFEKYLLMFAGLSSGNSINYTTKTLIILGVSYAALVLFIFIGIAMLNSLVYGMMKIYETRKERLVGLTWNELKPTFKHNMKRSFILYAITILLSIVVYAAMILLAIITPFTLFFAIIGLMICAVPLALLAPLYMFENIKIIDAIKKTFQLGFQTWGGILAICIVMGLLSSVINGVTSTPYYIGVFAKTLFIASKTPTSETMNILSTFVMYILAVIQSFGMYISMVICLVALGYQYGHSAEKYESITVNSDIDAFESKKDNNNDAPEVGTIDEEIDNFNKL